MGVVLSCLAPKCRFVYARAYVVRRAMGVPLCRGAVMPDDVCHGIRKATERSPERHFPARSVRPRVPRHTGCARRPMQCSGLHTPHHRTRMLTDITPITRKENPGGRREICREKRNPAGRRETAGSGEEEKGLNYRVCARSAAVR
ncbi:hypothetical protein BPORC_1895 [Bifidobacterium porcinum]|nr:hypothetical protein BPORC_1895 [Bifidobacterium porcinum]